MNKIDRIKDPLILDARNLNKPSERLNRFLLEGEDIVKWALDSEILIEHFFVSPSYDNQSLLDRLRLNEVVAYQCSEGIMKKINNSKYLTPIIAVASIKKPSGLGEGNMAVLLEDLQDQGNIGTIIRTACALGVNNIVTTGKSSDLYNRKTITASRGTVFNINHKNYGDPISAIRQLKASGYQIIATSPHGKELQSLVMLEDKPIVLLAGNETHGLSQEVLSLSDQIVQIPMHSDVESLNVGVATGISLYELKIKVLIAMLSKNIKSTLGRDLGVAHQLVRQVFDQEIKKICNYNSQQIVLMMIMVCDEEMSRSQLEKDIASHGDELDALLNPLLDDLLINKNQNNKYHVTQKGEEFLGKVWHAVEISEHKVFKGFSKDEIDSFRNYIQRIQKNCQSELE